MRRSAAPSQLASASKRPRFTPPFVNKPSCSFTPVKDTESMSADLKSSGDTLSNRSGEISSGNRSLPNVLHLIQQRVGPAKGQSNNASGCPSKNETPEISDTSCKWTSQPHTRRSSVVTENSKADEVCGTSTGNILTSSEIFKVGDENQPLTQHTEVSQGSKLKATSCKRSEKQTVDKSQKEINDDGITSAEQTPPLCQGLKPQTHTFRHGAFRQPLLQKPIPAKAASLENTEEVVSHYFSVVWCKLSKKKHKKWEGDAILITKGKSVTLLDTEGKEIGKGSGYKSSELASMGEGHTLRIGGKEIEVMGVVTQEDFTSGKCFQTTSAASPLATNLPPVKPRQAATKPFMNPQKGASSTTGENGANPVIKSVPKPLHDPTHPEALVMPRPSSAHQWANNPQHHPVVDVVLDPYLACKLRPHQREGVLFLYECVMAMRGFQGNGAILADDMGLGKTLQCICLIWTLFKQGPYRAKPVISRVLVVTPGSLVKNWCREFKKWLGSERIQVFPVSADKKVQEFANSPIYPVLIISYEMFVRSIEEIRKINFDLIVCDEGHRLKNTNIKTTSLISSLPVQRRILLTGTPVQNDLQEFHSIVEFCNPGILGSSGAFHRVYEEPITKGNQPQATAEEKKLAATRAAELSRLTSLFVLRRTQEINNKYLPPKVETVVFCKPSPLQLLLYQKLLGSRVLRSCLTASCQSGDYSSPHLVCILALKKLCNHPGLLHQACQDADMKHKDAGFFSEEFLQEESLYKDLLPLFPEDVTADSVNLEHSGKMQVLASLLRSLHKGRPSEKIVLVSNYTQTLGLLQKLCEQEGYKFCRLDGSTPTARRQEIVEHFNSSYAQETVFLLSSKAGGVGLNLIGASRLLLYDIDWNPANDLQAMARVWRDGQKKQVHIYRLITTGTIEEKVYQRQISKQGLSGAVVDAKSQGHVKFSLEDLKDLFTLHDSTSCITHDMMTCTCLSGETTPEAPQTVTNRACQLGVRNAQDKKNLSMNQLMEWKHFLGPLDETFEDGHLLGAGNKITFVFQNKTNMKPTSS